ncbi:TIGR00269 family protein [Candidatus Woesearchaeota archaeon]|nr:TIGR00269 family protein [Candidatus Woesearchaeota archaeon]
MKCAKCMRKAISTNPVLCSDHFIKYFEKKVMHTIKKYKLLKKNEPVTVAASGGKDSLSTLYILSKYATPTALLIDEGISGYRAKTIKDLQKFCEQNNIDYEIKTFKKEFGFTLDKYIKKTGANSCTVCGVLRRYLLNKYSKNKLATGHNLDDEAQAVLMNLLRSSVEQNARLGPTTGLVDSELFVTRIKPLYLMTEKQVATYAFYKKFITGFTICPYSESGFRRTIQTALNNLEQELPGTKERLINNYLKQLPKLKKQFSTSKKVAKCKTCNQPSRHAKCNACKIIADYKKLK